MSRRALKILYGILLTGAGLICLYAFSWHRPMMGEGSIWYYTNLGFRNFSYDPNFTRYLDILINQGPALLSLQLGASLKTALVLLDFMYAAHPFLSLLFCYFLLFKKERIELFAFPLLSFAVATLPVLPLSVSMAALALSVFWPVFLGLILRDPESLFEKIALVVGVVLLWFSYEPAILLLGLIAARSIFRCHAQKSIFNFEGLIAALAAAGALWLVYVVLRTPEAILKGHSKFLIEDIDAFRRYAYVSAVCFAINVLVSFRPVRLVSLLCFLGAQIWFVQVLIDGAAGQLIWFGPTTAFQARATAIPVAAAVAALLLLNKNENFLVKRSSVALLSVLVLFCSVSDVISTQIWRGGYEYVREKVLAGHGCRLIEKDEMEKRLYRANVQSIAIESLSIMIQISDGRDEITSLYFLDETEKAPGQPNSCENKRDGRYTTPHNVFEITSPFIRFSKELF